MSNQPRCKTCIECDRIERLTNATLKAAEEAQRRVSEWHGTVSPGDMKRVFWEPMTEALKELAREMYLRGLKLEGVTYSGTNDSLDVMAPFGPFRIEPKEPTP